jgi:DNA-binding MarR family transcriptional regulator
MTNEYDAIKLKNQLCFPLYLCAKELTRKYNLILKKYNLTYTQYVVMMYFWEKRTSNVKELGKALLLDSSTLTPLLKKLESKGYITRVRSKIDERNLNLEVTEKGLKLRDEALSIPMEMGKCINLTKEEVETLYKIIYKILINTQKEGK